MRQLQKTFSLFLALQLVFIAGFANQAFAEGWTKYKDEDGLFHVLIPDSYKINKKMLRIDDKEIIISGELLATVDQRPYKDVVKQYIVKYEQTFTHSIAENDIASLISLELGKYIDYYTAYGGVLLNKELGTFNGRPGGEVVISYRDKERGVQSIRVRIVYSTTTKVEQIVMGPEESMFAYLTKDFFSSLQVNDGRTNLPGEFKEEWETVVSPFELSAQLLPRKNPPFVPETPEFERSDKVERMSLKLIDPVFGHTLFYNLYGYRFNALMTSENVQRVIMDKHLKKFRINIGDLKFGVSAKDQYPVLSTKMHFRAPEQFPFMNTIKLYAYYFGNFMVVQELAGSNMHVESSLAKNLIKYFKFDPVRANDFLVKERAEKKMNELKNENENDNDPDNKT